MNVLIRNHVAVVSLSLLFAAASCGSPANNAADDATSADHNELSSSERLTSGGAICVDIGTRPILNALHADMVMTLNATGLPKRSATTPHELLGGTAAALNSHHLKIMRATEDTLLDAFSAAGQHQEVDVVSSLRGSFALGRAVPDVLSWLRDGYLDELQLTMHASDKIRGQIYMRAVANEIGRTIALFNYGHVGVAWTLHPETIFNRLKIYENSLKYTEHQRPKMVMATDCYRPHADANAGVASALVPVGEIGAAFLPPQSFQLIQLD